MNIILPPQIIPGLLDGSVTQIRVPMDPQPEEWEPLPGSDTPNLMWSPTGKNPFYNMAIESHMQLSPFGVAGDELVCLEEWAKPECSGFVYRADNPPAPPIVPLVWYEPGTMSKEAVRLTLRVGRVWVTRIGDALFSQRLAMGVNMTSAFVLRDFWNAMYPDHPYNDNPWCFAAEVERVTDAK